MPVPKKNEPTCEGAMMERIELLISGLLRGGVMTSMATVLVGVLLMFVHHPEYLKSAADLQRLTTPGAAFPHTLREVAEGVMAGRGQAVVALGLILLIATPILRVGRVHRRFFPPTGPRTGPDLHGRIARAPDLVRVGKSGIADNPE